MIICSTFEHFYANMVAVLVSYVWFGIFFAVQNVCSAHVVENGEPAPDFLHHSVVKPIIYHAREKRYISDTRKENEGHINNLQIFLDIEGERLTLDLALNKQLIPKGFFQKHQEGGKHVIYEPTKEEINLCHYNGKIRGKPNSWVAISTCDGLSGVINDGEETYYVEKDNKEAIPSWESRHFIYKHSDLIESNKTCGFTRDASDNTHSSDSRVLRYKRSALSGTDLIRGPSNSNRDSRYIELIFVVDNEKFKNLGESREKAISLCKNVANIVNGLYAPLDIFIALVGVVIWTEKDEIEFSTDGDITLRNFLSYRRTKLNPIHPNDNAQLLTEFHFSNSIVAKALKGVMCTSEFSGAVNTGYSSVVGLIATTIAHSLGHNFGMEHDTVDCKCADDRCIMSTAISAIAPSHWSSCSMDYLQLAFQRGMDYCLRNKPETLFDGPHCGNGFVEPGEECDCGLHQNCNSSCCDANTCLLHANASCATGECCDLNTCEVKLAGTLCRTADHECDLPEFCTGQSEYCPVDVHKMDTAQCSDGEAFCYRGSCKTRTDQCQLLWGNTGKTSDDQCYSLNTKGSRHGNCGYDRSNQTFYKCNPQDVFCGLLHCKHLNERLEFGQESAAILSYSIISKNDRLIPCRTAIVDLGNQQIDPGLTPNGAKCGEEKMCVDQKCRSIADLHKRIISCPKNCNGNGWCNSRGHCHCKKGFAPPLCDHPGPGGSEDSGPVSDLIDRPSRPDVEEGGSGFNHSN